MIVYHGSNSNFKQLKIDRNQQILENEGPGIYFSTNKELAKTYGRYLYTLEINNKYFTDFRNQLACDRYIGRISQEVFNKFNVEILYFIDMHKIVDGIRWGGLAVAQVAQEIIKCLESNENWYTNVSKTKREKIYSFLKSYNKNHIHSYMYTHSLQNVGVIKNTSRDVVKIVGKETIY